MLTCSLVDMFSCYDLRAFGVDQKPIYLPNNNLVCASKPGIAPKKIILNGRTNHCKIMEKRLPQPYPSGCLGKSRVEIIADNTKPSIAIVIKVLETTGKLLDKTV